MKMSGQDLASQTAWAIWRKNRHGILDTRSELPNQVVLLSQNSWDGKVRLMIQNHGNYRNQCPKNTDTDSKKVSNFRPGIHLL